MDAAARSLIARQIGTKKWAAGKKKAAALCKRELEVDRLQATLAWDWGDLCLEMVPPHKDNHVVHVLLRAFIEDYNYPRSLDTLKGMRQTCHRWPSNRRTKAPIYVHKILSPLPNRFELIADNMTSTEANRLAGHTQSVSQLRSTTATATECANAARSWSTTLTKRLDDNPSEATVIAISDAWIEMTAIVDSLGMLDELMAEYHDTTTTPIAA